MNMKRMRGRNHRPNGGGGGSSGGFRNQQNGTPLNRNHVFDSSGPEMRVRGTAQQLYEKYQQMARDASSSGDRVTGEAYYQYAEHYFRIISAINQAQGQPNPPQGGHQNGQAPYQNGGYQQNGQSDQNRRQDYNNGDGAEPQQPDMRQEYRPQEMRPQETRPQEQQVRNNQERRFEPRPKPEYARPERTERYRPEAPVVDTRIDISSALEAELAAATAEPAGFGDQPAIPALAAPEPRAIPIMADAPPAAAPAEEAVKIAKPRGRPRLVKPAASE